MPSITSSVAAWTSQIKSDVAFKVTFMRELLDQLRREKPDRIALLVSSEYEGIFHNGGVGTHYRTLSQHLAEDGWHVILLLTYTDRTFGGRSELSAVKHVFSTKEGRDALELHAVHEGLLAESRHDHYDYAGLCQLFFAQAITKD